MEPDLFRISYSKLACYQQCLKQYWFKYVSGQQWPEQRDTPASLIGTGVHRAMKVLCDTDDAELARHELDAYTRMPIHAQIAKPSAHYDTAFELLERGITVHEEITSDRRWAELSSWTRWESRGVAVTTTIDRIDELPSGELQLIDWKTGSWSFGEEIDLQLDIAHVVARKARNLPRETDVTTIGWNLRTGEKRVRPLHRDDAVATLKYLAVLAERINGTTEWPANPSPACTFCDWRERCPEAAAGAISEEDLMLDVELEARREAAPLGAG